MLTPVTGLLLAIALAVGALSSFGEAPRPEKPASVILDDGAPF